MPPSLARPGHCRHSRWPAGLLLAAMLVACQAQPLASGSAPSGAAAEAALLQRIHAEVGSAACSSQADCRTLPMGSKACGGPAGWLAWSASASQGDRLQTLAAELAARQQQRQAAEGMMSTCSVVPDPGARCEAGRCILNRPASQR